MSAGSKEPPHLPTVVDEAGASPAWVPWLGLGLLCAVALFVALRQAIVELSPPPAAAAAVADGGTAGAGDQAAVAAKPSAAPAAAKPADNE